MSSTTSSTSEGRVKRNRGGVHTASDGDGRFRTRFIDSTHLRTGRYRRHNASRKICGVCGGTALPGSPLTRSSPGDRAEIPLYGSHVHCLGRYCPFFISCINYCLSYIINSITRYLISATGPTIASYPCLTHAITEPKTGFEPGQTDRRGPISPGVTRSETLG